MKDQKEVKKSEYALVNAVVIALNLGDYGKIEGFVKKTAKTLEREVDTAERSIKNEQHNHKSMLSALNEKLEDAQTAVEDTYTNLDPAKLKTNEQQRAFMEIYLELIKEANGLVLTIEKEIEEVCEKSKEIVKELRKQIKIRREVIARLTKGIVK